MKKSQNPWHEPESNIWGTRQTFSPMDSLIITWPQAKELQQAPVDTQKLSRMKVQFQCMYNYKKSFYSL